MNSDTPLVLCLTNTVAANFTANVLLAYGAKPAMIEEVSEARQLARMADSMLVNLGTVNAAQAEVMKGAVEAAGRETPWVLDPVAVHLLDYRSRVMEDLLKAGRPSMIRGNHAEIEQVRNVSRGGSQLRDEVVMLATGEVDRIYTGNEGFEEIGGGVERLQTVTATGCAQGALGAAMLGKGMSPLEAARAASRLMKRAGEMAYAKSQMPGSFKVALVDAIWELRND